MALFLSADIHQGDERFSVHSRGKQSAFMSLSALLTARNISLNSWSSVTFKNALLQGDKMFLNALGSGFIILDPGVEFLSVENLPTVLNVACCTNLLNDFSYEICETLVQAKTTASPMMMTNNDLHIVGEPFESQNNIIETQTYSTELATQSKTTSPMKVTDTTYITYEGDRYNITYEGDQYTTSPVMVIDTASPVRVTNTTSPVRVTNTKSQPGLKPVLFLAKGARVMLTQ